ncbi:uncharacterized protein LOC144433932 isoform X2 [Glandiceps talaboti]
MDTKYGLDRIELLGQSVVEFSQRLVSIYEQQANSLRSASETFRKKTSESLKENTLREEDVPGIVGLWKVILQETEYEAEANNVLAKTLTDNFVLPLQDCGNQQKQVIKRLVSSQEELEEKLTKSRETLMKSQKEYHESWTKAKSRDPSSKSCAMSACYQAHNEYLLQLTAINQFLQKYYQSALPEVLADFEEFHLHLAKSIAQCLTATAKANHTKFRERSHRLELIMDTCATVEKHKDGGRLPAPIRRAMKAHTRDSCNYIIPDHGIPAEFLTEELISNEDTRGPLTQRHDSLKKEARELEVKISYSEKAIETLLEKYENLLQSQHYGRAYETKEEILKLKQAKRNARTQLAICKDQLKLFTSEVLTDAESEPRPDSPRDFSPRPRFGRQDSGREPNGHIPDHDEKTPPLSPKSPAKKCNGSVPTSHLFQEHTFKKPTTCENCKALLSGLVKQCVKCTACKMAAHQKCIDQLPPCTKRVEGRGKLYRQNSFTALTNFTKKNLLRRQRSLSDVFRPSSPPPKDENDNKAQSEIDFVYETIKNAKSMSGLNPEERAHPGGASGYDTDGSDVRSTYTSRRSSIASTMSTMSTVSLAKSQDSRRSIMKGRSISLDYTDPKLSKKGSIRKQGYAVETKRSVSLPSDPHQGRVVYQHFDAENLQDEGDRGKIYIALHDFEGGKTDDLPLKAGVLVSVLDKPSERWWKGKASGEVGYFPSYCVEVLESWERPLRVTRSYSAAEQANQLSLKRGQIVIQISEPENGWVVVKTGQRETGRFPYQYLQPLMRKSSAST